jgi:hypothetical protein
VYQRAGVDRRVERHELDRVAVGVLDLEEARLDLLELAREHHRLVRVQTLADAVHDRVDAGDALVES